MQEQLPMLLNSPITTGVVCKITFGAEKWRENPRNMSHMSIFGTEDTMPRFIEVVHFYHRDVAF